MKPFGQLKSRFRPTDGRALGFDNVERVTVDEVMVEERAASFTKRSIKSTAKLSGLRLARFCLYFQNAAIHRRCRKGQGERLVKGPVSF